MSKECEYKINHATDKTQVKKYTIYDINGKNPTYRYLCEDCFNYVKTNWLGIKIKETKIRN